MLPIVGPSLHFGRVNVVSQLLSLTNGVVSELADRVGLKQPEPITDQWSPQSEKPTPLYSSVERLTRWAESTLMPRVSPAKDFSENNAFKLLSTHIGHEVVVSYPFLFKWMHRLGPTHVDRVHLIRDEEGSVVGFNLDAHLKAPRKIIVARTYEDGSSCMVYRETNHMTRMFAIKEYPTGERVVLKFRHQPLSHYYQFSLTLNEKPAITGKIRASRIVLPHDNNLLNLSTAIDAFVFSEKRSAADLLRALEHKPLDSGENVGSTEKVAAEPILSGAK